MTENGRRPAFVTEDRDRKAFSDLLDLAESLQRRVEKYDQMGASMMLRALFSISSGVVLGVASKIFIIEYNSMLVFGIVTFFGLLSASFIFKCININKKYKREVRALKETMDIVHEVYSSLSDVITPLEMAEVKIRLSRLDL